MTPQELSDYEKLMEQDTAQVLKDCNVGLSNRHSYDMKDYLAYLMETHNATKRGLYEKFFRWGATWGAGKFMPDVPFLQWLDKRKEKQCQSS